MWDLIRRVEPRSPTAWQRRSGRRSSSDRSREKAIRPVRSWLKSGEKDSRAGGRCARPGLRNTPATAGRRCARSPSANEARSCRRILVAPPAWRPVRRQLAGWKPALRRRAVALLVFFPGSAGAGIVAADLRLFSLDGLRLLLTAGEEHRLLFRFRRRRALNARLLLVLDH